MWGHKCQRRGGPGDLNRSLYMNMKLLAWGLAGMAVIVIPEHFGVPNSMGMSVDRQVLPPTCYPPYQLIHSFIHSLTRLRWV